MAASGVCITVIDCGMRGRLKWRRMPVDHGVFQHSDPRWDLNCYWFPPDWDSSTSFFECNHALPFPRPSIFRSCWFLGPSVGNWNRFHRQLSRARVVGRPFWRISAAAGFSDDSGADIKWESRFTIFKWDWEEEARERKPKSLNKTMLLVLPAADGKWWRHGPSFPVINFEYERRNQHQAANVILIVFNGNLMSEREMLAVVVAGARQVAPAVDWISSPCGGKCGSAHTGTYTHSHTQKIEW